MKPVHLAARAVLALAALSPWLWLVLFVAFATAATVHLGRLPSYNNPDPKHIVQLAWLHAATSLLLLPVGLSPLAIGACLGVRAFVSPDIGDERGRLLVYSVGYGLFALVIFGDVLGLGRWFLD